MRKDLACTDCGSMMWRGPTSLPDGSARCLPCRQSAPTGGATVVVTEEGYRRRFTPCVDCGILSAPKSPRCMACAVARRPRGKGKDRDKRLALNRRRQALLRSAPGLTYRQRYALLAKWKRQGRACTYCPELATTVDHVIPVSLGGTNYEGNLTPACRSCNGRKNDSLLIEFRRKLELAA